MSIRTKLILFISVLLSVTVLIAGSISYIQTTNLVSNRLFLNELPATVNSIRNNIEKRLNVYLIASRGIASNTYAMEWFGNGEDPAGVEAWAKYAGQLVKDTKAASATLASASTRKYYDQNGYNEAASKNLKYWFDGFIERGQDYEMVLDKSDSTGNRWMMFTNIRVEKSGNLASVGLGVIADDLANEIASIRVGESGHVYLANSDGTYKLHKDKSLIGEANMREAQGLSDVADTLLKATNGDEGEVNITQYSGAEGEIIAASSWIPTIQSFVVVEIPAAEVFGEIKLTMLNIGLIVLVVLMLAIFGVFLLAQRISNPIKRITDCVDAMANGETQVTVPAQQSKDEIGNIARAVEIFRQGLIEKIQLEEEQKKSAIRSEEEKKALLAKMASDFEANVGSIVTAVSNSSQNLNGTAQSMSSIASDTQEKARVVALASEEASNNVQTVSAATEELTASSQEISHQVDQSAAVARDAVHQAQLSQDSISQLIEAAQKIGEVVNLITDIADQTNLLALNATIEAARAGDAGKGFAVVASEVKSLANQTASATEEIRNQVNGIQSSTTNAAGAIENVAKTIRQIDEIASSVAAAVEEQTAATH
ncbi:MAG: methyl-accepting chemotaxis protein, partial [Alphaproteobacteria bacterium]|nr:methyl-accepting chemotaxis protein [Alphaproteobacteria bacterium]